MSKIITLEAPAKVNLWLSVLGRRKDGYHELRMVNTLVDLCDRVEIEIAGSGVRVECDHPSVPEDETNLAVRAARKILERVPGPKPGVKIKIEKRVPVAAGLGGGSSDAAAVLKGLTRLVDISMTREELMRAGLELGADVPFFLYGKPALVEGIGERIVPIPRVPDWTYLLATPPIEVKTVWAYEELDTLVSNDKLILTKPEQSAILIYLGSWTASSIPESLINDLEAPVTAAYPIISELKEHMMGQGAQASVMSGSGPTVVGLFIHKGEASKAREELCTKFDNLYTAIAQTKLL